MFDFFKKKGPETIDLVDLEKRGVVQRSREAKMRQLSKATSNGMVDFASMPSSSASSTSSSSSETETNLGFLGALAGGSEPSVSQNISPSFSSLASGDESKSKLAKRLLDMTTKLESQDKEIYQLQQRIELLERKLDAKGY